jgi:hypothetical protein
MNLQDRTNDAFKMYEGDIFLKHGEEPDSSHVVIKRNQVSIHAAPGATGLMVKSNGTVTVQGKLVIKESGFTVEKGMFTENPLSFIPSTYYSQIASYLFKIPLEEISGSILDSLKSFLELF